MHDNGSLVGSLKCKTCWIQLYTLLHSTLQGTSRQNIRAIAKILVETSCFISHCWWRWRKYGWRCKVKWIRIKTINLPELNNHKWTWIVGRVELRNLKHFFIIIYMFFFFLQKRWWCSLHYYKNYTQLHIYEHFLYYYTCDKITFHCNIKLTWYFLTFFFFLSYLLLPSRVSYKYKLTSSVET